MIGRSDHTMEHNSKMQYSMNSVQIKESPNIINLQELHNKMELLKERTGL